MDPRGIHDIFINDLVGMMVDIDNNAQRMTGSAMLAIFSAACPNQNEPIPREPMEALNKLFAEAAPEEIKIILGWIFDFHQMLILLPENKFIVWTKELLEMIARGTSTAKDLSQHIGRFVHLGVVIPVLHHFLSRLHKLEQQTEGV